MQTRQSYIQDKIIEIKKNIHIRVIWCTYKYFYMMMYKSRLVHLSKLRLNMFSISLFCQFSKVKEVLLTLKNKVKTLKFSLIVHKTSVFLTLCIIIVVVCSVLLWLKTMTKSNLGEKRVYFILNLGVLSSIYTILCLTNSSNNNKKPNFNFVVELFLFRAVIIGNF